MVALLVEKTFDSLLMTSPSTQDHRSHHLQQLAIGLDIGGTKISGCLVDSAGQITDSRLALTPKTSASDVLSELKRVIFELLNSTEAEKTACIGVSTGGDVDHDTGEILAATGSIPGWKGVKLGEFLRNEFRYPVFVGNDGNMAVYGEWKVGAAQGYHDVVGLTIGTGLGGGIISDGSLLCGARGGAANFGFLPAPQLVACDAGAVKKPLEYYLSGPGIVPIGKILRGSNTLSNSETGTGVEVSFQYREPREILLTASEGDPVALRIVNIFLEYLQYALSVIQRVLSPEIVVLGGGVLRGDFVAEKIEEIAVNYPFVLRISSLENKAGMIGAGLYALERTTLSTSV